MLLQVASVIRDTIRMFESPQKSNFLQNILPLFQGLLPAVRHLLDGHDLRGDVVPGIVDSAEGAMADLSKIVKELLRIFALEQFRHVRVLQAARPKLKMKHQAGSFCERENELFVLQLSTFFFHLHPSKNSV